MSKRKTTEEFIEEAKNIYGDFYNYSKSVYVSSRDKIIITCPIHGDFEKTPKRFLNNDNCILCKSEARKTNNDKFIKECSLIHNNYYNYTKTVYNGFNSMIIITCPVHGDFIQKAYMHKSGKGCRKCSEKSKKDFINEANIYYDFLYDYTKTEYTNSYTHIIITCKKHGDFKILSKSHLNGYGCPECKRLENIEIFKQKSNIIHNNYYNYDKVNFKYKTDKVIINCPEHGDFEQTAHSHENLKHGCPICSKSKGELKIRKILEDSGLIVEYQKRFDNCRNIYPLPFDFYISELNTCIEFDGRQHYEVVDRFGGEESLKYTQYNDNIKTEYCNSNNITLIRIKYNENIEEKLETILNKKARN